MSHIDTELLNRLILGAVTGSELQSSNAHLQGCSDCRERIATVRQDAQDFESRHLAATLEGVLARVGHRKPSRRWAWGALAAGATAAIVAIVLFRAPADRFATRGGAGLSILIKREGSVRIAHPGDALQSRDQIQVSADVGPCSHLLILAEDSAGNRSVLTPDPMQSVRVGPERYRLSSAFEVESVDDLRRLYGVFSTTALSSADAQKRLAQKGPCPTVRWDFAGTTGP